MPPGVYLLQRGGGISPQGGGRKTDKFYDLFSGDLILDVSWFQIAVKNLFISTRSVGVLFVFQLVQRLLESGNYDRRCFPMKGIIQLPLKEDPGSFYITRVGGCMFYEPPSGRLFVNPGVNRPLFEQMHQILGARPQDQSPICFPFFQCQLMSDVITDRADPQFLGFPPVSHAARRILAGEEDDPGRGDGTDPLKHLFPFRGSRHGEKDLVPVLQDLPVALRPRENRYLLYFEIHSRLGGDPVEEIDGDPLEEAVFLEIVRWILFRQKSQVHW